jgi:hypothetical protein
MEERAGVRRCFSIPKINEKPLTPLLRRRARDMETKDSFKMHPFIFSLRLCIFAPLR